ncbi:restriction endonuclease subunit S [Bacillus sp. SG-1]|uniref:restriction endonuclease subunit S n=1 Tax=Bacillus sp. SG-1 TaxID=161544 RepID=UPI0001543F9F|nr:restriction endonuclease subunit S [Bacillus sp. SG-1]EDL65724.1 putative type I restriction enzyme specificity protein [Bacillus sp. SG-1]
MVLNEFQNSADINWYERVPEDWSEKKLKYLVETIKGYAFKSQLFGDKGVPIIKTTDIKNGKIQDSDIFIDERFEHEYKNVRVKKNDILMSTVGSKVEVTNSAVGQIGKVQKKYEGALLNQNAVILRCKSKDITNNFLFYFLNSHSYRKYLDLFAHGTANQASLSLKDILDFKMPLPSRKIQHQISEFLDHKTSDVETLIADKQKLIELLEEKRQAIVTEAVTRGLNPDVKMKDSGVKWIGDIPEHWDISKIKYSTYVKGRIGWQGLRSDEFIDEGPYLVTGTDFKDGIIHWDTCYHISEERYSEAPPIQLKENDLLITKDGTIGKVAIVKNKPGKAILNSGIFVTRCQDKEYLTKFMYWILTSEVFKNYIKYMETGSTIKHLYQETFVNFSYPLPNIEEQKAIEYFLETKVREIDSVKKEISDQIELLKEYRQSLIYEAVTGKIDLRDYQEVPS